MIVRRANLNDILTIIELEKKYFVSSLGVDFLTNLITNLEQYVYILEDKEIIGYMSALTYDFSVEIIKFLIKKPYQNRGFGNKLFAYFYKQVRMSQKKLIILQVRVDNIIAVNFYKKLNFKIIQIIKNYYSDGADAYSMENIVL